MKNVDTNVVKGFGEEWDSYNQSSLTDKETKDLFDRYFNIFPKDFFAKDKIGIDVGCGSGRWAKHIAPLVKGLHCVDASNQALNVAKNTPPLPSQQYYFAGMIGFNSGEIRAKYKYWDSQYQTLYNLEHSSGTNPIDISADAVISVYVYLIAVIYS